MVAHYITLKPFVTKKRLGIFFIVVLFVFSAEGKKLFPQFPSANKPLSLEIQSEYYYSTANYTDLGSFTDLPAGNHFLYNIQDFTLDYSAWKWFSLELFLKTGYGNSRTRQVDYRNFNLIETGFGFSFLQKYGAFHWNWDFKGGIPLNYNPPIRELVIIGDGAFYGETGMWFIYGIQPRFLYLFAHSRLRYRTNQLSSLWSNQLGFFVRTKHLQWGTRANVFFSFPFIDGYTHSPNTRWDTTDRLNGGSYKFLSVNPGVLSFSSWLKWKVHPFSTLFYVDFDTYGMHYGKGFTLGGNVAFTFNTKTDSLSFLTKKVKRKRSRQGKRNQYFSEEPDRGGPSSELQNEINRLK